MAGSSAHGAHTRDQQRVGRGREGSRKRTGEQRADLQDEGVASATGIGYLCSCVLWRTVSTFLEESHLQRFGAFLVCTS